MRLIKASLLPARRTASPAVARQDIGAVEIEPDALGQVPDHLLGQAGVSADAAYGGAAVARFDRANEAVVHAAAYVGVGADHWLDLHRRLPRVIGIQPRRRDDVPNGDASRPRQTRTSPSRDHVEMRWTGHQGPAGDLKLTCIRPRITEPLAIWISALAREFIYNRRRNRDCGVGGLRNREALVLSQGRNASARARRAGLVLAALEGRRLVFASGPARKVSLLVARAVLRLIRPGGGRCRSHAVFGAFGAPQASAG